MHPQLKSDRKIIVIIFAKSHLPENKPNNLKTKQVNYHRVPVRGTNDWAACHFVYRHLGYCHFV